MPRDGDDGSAALCVLASSSRGNCSVIRVNTAGERRLILIDAGLSPRRTRERLADAGESQTAISAIVLTHLDQDHWNLGWLAALPPETPVFVHHRHLEHGLRQGVLPRHALAFEDRFEASPGVTFAPELLDHDEHGVAAFRVEFTPTGRWLGYATDIGRPCESLVRHLAGVDVLAIESNYCPDLQDASDRPAALKDRIMGGAGHLSNQQSAWAVNRIAPHERVVLLHLSQECNTPERALAAHASSRVGVIASAPDVPTAWVSLAWPGASPGPRPAFPAVRHRQGLLWGSR